MSDIKPPPWLLAIIVFSQFATTSLWFAGNAVLPDLKQQWQLPEGSLGSVVSAVQFGFITGTLVFAFFSLPDRFSPRKVFLFCAMAGATINASLVVISESYFHLLLIRFLTGFFLAGLYPVGMKIAAGWYQHDLGKAIGFLVGALVLGTAFPHLLVSMGGQWPWSSVLLSISALTYFGGAILYYLVPDGPYLRQGTPFNPRALAAIFQSKAFRPSAFGYFGHMWELYAFWTFAPWVLAAHIEYTGNESLNIPFWAFVIIALGGMGCAGGGVLSQWIGSARVATYQLSISGMCCLLSPLLFFAPTPIYLVFLMLWGLTISGDSPQFSALNAMNAPKDLVGSALTIVNCIGFIISIISLELLNLLRNDLAPQWLFMVLAFGPIFGVRSMLPLLKDGFSRRK